MRAKLRMYSFTLTNTKGEEVFCHSEPSYDELISWGVGSGQECPEDAVEWKVVDPNGNILEKGVV